MRVGIYHVLASAAALLDGLLKAIILGILHVIGDKLAVDGVAHALFASCTPHAVSTVMQSPHHHASDCDSLPLNKSAARAPCSSA